MIEVLSSVYNNIPADLAPVRRGQRQYRELNSTLDRNTELKTLIQQMEAYYDAQLDSEEASSPSAEKSETSGTQLSPEIEQFLSELGERLDADPDE
jgi:biotin-(acetyl-CoA carboxylase) ligase